VAEDDDRRRRLLQAIRSEFAYTRSLTGDGAPDPRVEQALERVHRDAFVPSGLVAYAYDNNPLPIGHGQTISQPYIVALMTDLLALEEDDVVLEVGTGSGYQAAILSQLVCQVYSIEIIRELGEEAAERLNRLGYDNVSCRTGDGYYGWPEHAPYDAIIVTAAAENVPPPLVAQLKPNGRMILPVEKGYGPQELILVEKTADGTTRSRDILPVSFVPLTGDHSETDS
jgi:protein-L-isoaspartate(D-aspartate) O-methyltransferase